ncbi:hypothetical protein IWX48DRAFT_296939 [Phyllosticta citricarpa]
MRLLTAAASAAAVAAGNSNNSSSLFQTPSIGLLSFSVHVEGEPYVMDLRTEQIYLPAWRWPGVFFFSSSFARHLSQVVQRKTPPISVVPNVRCRQTEKLHVPKQLAFSSPQISARCCTVITVMVVALSLATNEPISFDLSPAPPFPPRHGRRRRAMAHQKKRERGDNFVPAPEMGLASCNSSNQGVPPSRDRPPHPAKFARSDELVWTT